MEKKTDVKLVGHAHIDAVWLWDRAETKDVLVNTFTRILDLMDKYPDVTFIQTSAQYYKWMEDEHPEIFSRIKEKIERGTWEVTGGMWVEPDCNMPDGESLCRQFLYGQKYFRNKFGIDCRICWLPDVFGFGWTLPSIMKDSGIKYFFTSKLIWQSKLPFPHRVFSWKGPDDSVVLGYQTPGMYNNLDIYDVYKQSIKFLHSTGYGFFLAPFGEGDHGGGLSEELVEMVHNQKHAMDVSFGNALEYFNKLSSEIQDIPEVRDELYLNTHRGTLTTQSRMKYLNRKYEKFFNKVDKAESIAKLMGSHASYSRLSDAWELLLVNQFHDALPGSSIKKVYEDVEYDYAMIDKALSEAYKEDLSIIIPKLDSSWCKTPVAVFNEFAWVSTRHYIAETDIVNPRFVLKSGKEIYSQKVGDGKYLLAIESLPPVSFETISVEGGCKGSDTDLFLEETSISYILSNQFVRIEILKENGRVVSLRKKGSDLEYLGSEGAGFLEFYEDFTTAESAWNICKGREFSAEFKGVYISCDGPVVKGITGDYIFTDQNGSQSVIHLACNLYCDSPIVEFVLDIDWHAAYVTCQAKFTYSPSKDVSKYQIAYGTIDRLDSHSSKANPYIRERWEVSGHGWSMTERSDGNGGVVVFSDSKYGFGQNGSSMHLTLLRSPVYPDPSSMGLPSLPVEQTDQGHHIIRYGLMATDSGVKINSLHRLAAEFESLDSVFAVSEGIKGKDLGLISGISENIFINTIKPAEDGDGLIVRFFETEGIDGDAYIDFAISPETAIRCDILEDPKSCDSICINGNSVKIGVRHNEIVSMRIKFKEDSYGI